MFGVERRQEADRHVTGGLGEEPGRARVVEEGELFRDAVVEPVANRLEAEHGIAPELVGILHYRIFGRDGLRPGVMAIDDRGDQVDVGPGVAQAAKYSPGNGRAFDFVLAPKLRVAGPGSERLENLLLRYGAPSGVVEDDGGKDDLPAGPAELKRMLAPPIPLEVCVVFPLVML